MNLPEEIELLLDRYVAGECSPAEILAVRSWIGNDAERAGLVDRLLAARALERSHVAPADVGKAVGRLEAALDAEERRSPAAVKRVASRRPLQVGVWASLACAAAVLVLVIRAPHRGPAAWREYVTRAGQRESVTLSDGTRFTLAPVSRLRVPVDYTSGDRAVQLDGEAYFAVAHDAAHPFSVRARDAVATDIGTMFDVRAYSDDRAVRVAVSEGTVGVRAVRAARMPRLQVGDRATLSRGDVAMIADTVVAISRGADVGRMTAWLQGALIFDAMPLRDAIRDLDRMYDLDIVIADTTLAATRITTSVGPEPVDDVLASVTYAIGARYERSGRRVVIRRQSGAAGGDSSRHVLELQTARGHSKGR